ncbi:hypothetical protein MRX96_041566 [Rhipicephalus microplus]
MSGCSLGQPRRRTEARARTVAHVQKTRSPPKRCSLGHQTTPPRSLSGIHSISPPTSLAQHTGKAADSSRTDWSGSRVGPASLRGDTKISLPGGFRMRLIPVAPEKAHTGAGPRERQGRPTETGLRQKRRSKGCAELDIKSRT